MGVGSKIFRKLTNSPTIRRTVLREFWRQVLPDSRRRPTTDGEAIAFLGFAAGNASRANSKTGQDLWVAYESAAKTDGFFVEFGAENGLRGSNSLMFENHYGWRGILAEPNPLWADTFKKNRPNAFHSTECVWTKSGDTIAFAATDNPGLSTIKAYVNASNRRSQRAKHKEVLVPTTSLNDLLARFDAPQTIDYISMDTEGSEFEILSVFNFDAWNVRFFTIECAGPTQEARLEQLMTAHGYERRFPEFSKGDVWYRKRAP